MPRVSHDTEGTAKERALNQALADVFLLLANDGQRDPVKLAEIVLNLELLLGERFPPMIRRKVQRPLPFVFAERYLVLLRANKSDQIEKVLARLFPCLVGDPTFHRNIEQAILAVVAAHYGSKLARTLWGCELDADLYADMVEHADGSRELGHGQVLGLAVPLSSRSAFSPIAGYSSARKAAIRHVVDWEDLLRETPDYGVWAFTLTMPIPPRTWASYAELQEAYYFRDLDERFKKRMRDLGMRVLVVGREIAFTGDHLHVHRHVLYLGLEPAIDAVQRAWDAALWPDGKPEGQPPAYVDFADVVPMGGHPTSNDMNRLERAMTYALKGRHAPSPWTASALAQWGEFVATVKKHPRRSSVCKGPGVIAQKRSYERRTAPRLAQSVAAMDAQGEPTEMSSPAPTFSILQVSENDHSEPCLESLDEPEFPDNRCDEFAAAEEIDDHGEELARPSEMLFHSAFAREAQKLVRGLVSPPIDFNQLSRLQAANVGTVSSYLATHSSPLDALSHGKLALAQMFEAYEAKLCACVLQRRQNNRRLGRPVPLLTAEPTVPELPPITKEQLSRLRAAKRDKWKLARGRRL